MSCGGPKKSPRTASIVHIIFSFWSFIISGGILRNQKIINGLDSFSKKVQVSKDQEKAQSVKRFPLQKPRWEKTKLTIRYLYLNLTKNMKTHIRRQQHKNHLDIKQKGTTTEVLKFTKQHLIFLASFGLYYSF